MTSSTSNTPALGTMTTIVYGIGVSEKSKRIAIIVKTSPDRKGNSASTLKSEATITCQEPSNGIIAYTEGFEVNGLCNVDFVIDEPETT